MKDENLLYGFNHWMKLHLLGESIRARMIEIPAGDIVIGGREFHVGKFMIAKSLVTEHSWERVMEKPAVNPRRPVTGISYVEMSDYIQRVKVPWKRAGHLTIPTEAQLERALRLGLICHNRKYKELCLTHFRDYDKMGEHHFFDNLPREEPFDLVVRGDSCRTALSYNHADDMTGFRLALVDYEEKNDEELLKYIMEGIQ